MDPCNFFQHLLKLMTNMDVDGVPQSVIEDAGVYNSRCGYCKQSGTSIAHGKIWEIMLWGSHPVANSVVASAKHAEDAGST